MYAHEIDVLEKLARSGLGLSGSIEGADAAGIKPPEESQRERVHDREARDNGQGRRLDNLERVEHGDRHTDRAGKPGEEVCRKLPRWRQHANRSRYSDKRNHHDERQGDERTAAQQHGLQVDQDRCRQHQHRSVALARQDRDQNEQGHQDVGHGLESRLVARVLDEEAPASYCDGRYRQYEREQPVAAAQTLDGR